MRKLLVSSAVLLSLLAGCAGFEASPSLSSTIASPSSSDPGPGTTSSSTPSGTLNPSSSTPPPVPTLANGEALPACEPGAPKASDTVTFVAVGHVWALSPRGDDLTCLFAVDDAGPFEWGPLGDRVLLGGLEVRGVAGGPSLAASGQSSKALTWTRPTGTSIVLAPGSGSTLEKVHLDGTPTEDVTPLDPATYLSVTYHSSGEAFAFVVDLPAGDELAGQSIWISTNKGKTPFRMVFSEEGTTFGAMGFEVDGKHLLYAAQHNDNHPELHRIDVTDTTQAPVVWDGPVGRQILDIKPGRQSGTLAWTTGASGTPECEDSIAMAQTPKGTVRVLPDVAEPTRAIGWLGDTQLLVATGGCDGFVDLLAVDLSTGASVPLVSGVSAAAVRTPVPTPPAPLPAAVASLGSGFS